MAKIVGHHLLGVTAGASTGAAATILFGVGTALGASSLTGSAFIGALASMAVVFALARIGAGSPRSGC